MSTSAEARASQSPPDGPLGPAWRQRAARTQLAGLPDGKVLVSCSAPLGTGGLGRHLQEILDALERGQRSTHSINASTRASLSRSTPQHPRHVLGLPYLANALSALPLQPPLAPALRTRAFMAEFDAYAAEHLSRADHLIAFNGQALTQLAAARRAGYESTSLVSANSHIEHLARQHALAHRQYPLEGSWSTHLVKRNLAEYAQVERIYVSSRYVRESFLRAGFAEERLVDFPLTPDPRYSPRERVQPQRFDVVYVGSLAVHKGVPLLIDAFRRLEHAELRLVLVGGWGTRGMRRFVQSACAADRRISVSPGDPLPHLRAASLCVHPAYEDGFAYAPAEALACGVPVIVSQDTGMKELIDSPRSGLILPTGDVQALTEAIDGAYRGELLAR